MNKNSIAYKVCCYYVTMLAFNVYATEIHGIRLSTRYTVR